MKILRRFAAVIITAAAVFIFAGLSVSAETYTVTITASVVGEGTLLAAQGVRLQDFAGAADTSNAGQYVFSEVPEGTYRVLYSGGDTEFDIVVGSGYANALTLPYYKVTFQSEGSISGSRFILTGKYVDEPSDPTRSGYTFAGWEDAPGHLFDFTNTEINGAITLTAAWTANPAAPAVTSIYIIGVNKLEVGKTTGLGAALYPIGATGVVSWSSSDETVATVSSTGLVTGLKPGAVTITARVGGVSAEHDITVNPATVAITSITLPETVYIVEGETAYITAAVTPENSTGGILWSSSDESVLELIVPDATLRGCTVRGRSAGTATLTATAENDPTIFATATVVVEEFSLDLTYSETAPTSVVIVTITSNMPINEPLGWGASNSYTIRKIFRENEEDSVIVSTKDGSFRKTVSYSVRNIVSSPPESGSGSSSNSTRMPTVTVTPDNDGSLNEAKDIIERMNKLGQVNDFITETLTVNGDNTEFVAQNGATAALSLDENHMVVVNGGGNPTGSVNSESTAAAVAQAVIAAKLNDQKSIEIKFDADISFISVSSSKKLLDAADGMDAELKFTIADDNHELLGDIAVPLTARTGQIYSGFSQAKYETDLIAKAQLLYDRTITVGGTTIDDGKVTAELVLKTEQSGGWGDETATINLRADMLTGRDWTKEGTVDILIYNEKADKYYINTAKVDESGNVSIKTKQAGTIAIFSEPLIERK